MVTEQPLRKAVVIGPRTGQRLPKGEIGIIVHYDLTDKAVVPVIQTDDIGYETDEGYEVIGKTWDNIIGFGAAGNLCSTVAERTIAYGAPCSTVADRMMIRQGNPR